MPEGHSVHRIAARFADLMVGRRVAVSSPQGRFAAGAALLDGRTIEESYAVGKQLFLSFSGELCLRVHLGLYGAWDFARLTGQGERAGQTGEYSLAQRSMGAPRKLRAGRVTRLRAGENELPRPDETAAETVGGPVWPPEPVGAVRARLLTADACADLRGPTACEVLEPGELTARLRKLGPDPLVDGRAAGGRRFISVAQRKRTPIGTVLMDQAVVAGIGNIYRAELLFRARVNPHTAANALPVEVLRALWDDWCRLLPIGVETGVIVTRTRLRGAAKQLALETVEGRHAVYGRAGQPCYRCHTPVALEVVAGRKLYWCPGCQLA
ncbi:Fpg/Nei family DNA glycosylase [Brevibacterium sp. 50QC2O2]|uniref:Fpg/Nei family DNA glycosylase n=1 Tax=Brevibacterium TaxID=1696 RepID=UPI00211C8C9E|nr:MULTISPECIES: DNA-formamidopyrimidine glycosylase family protein [unclassified Brevibacterium]MCQ9366638.1 Fpg/Nei family DNA glycosylase [Brevibacterium sp. 91QC2O2]MCQ9384480.1 Fpg/Nei family DNA glycosylase [Brevibacterium sp. 68QC2CO]MCQ9389622.1 Fpg/Nei family DNA glycosylase [Brevibacterium sp. 50QC2O2]